MLWIPHIYDEINSTEAIFFNSEVPFRAPFILRPAYPKAMHFTAKYLYHFVELNPHQMHCLLSFISALVKGLQSFQMNHGDFASGSDIVSIILTYI